MRRSRAQTGLEIMIVIAVLSTAGLLVMDQTDLRVQEVAQNRAESTFKDLARSVHEVQVQGSGASKKVEVFVPDNVVPERTKVKEGSIVLALSEKGHTKEIAVPVDGCFRGEIPTQSGTHEVVITGGECATLGGSLIEAHPMRLLEWLAPGEQTTKKLSLSADQSVQAEISVEDSLASFIDLDESQPGIQSQIQVTAPTELNLQLIIPEGTDFGTKTGSIKVSTNQGTLPVGVQLIVYTSSLELSTYASESREQESDLFYIDQPVFFRAVSRRNNQLFSTQINTTLKNVSQNIIHNKVSSAPNGILDGEAYSSGEPGYYELIVHDLETGAIRSKELQGVKPVSWRMEFDTGSSAPRYASSESSGVVKFQLKDQLGNPITDLWFEEEEEVIPLSSGGWKYIQESCNGADACTPSECPVSEDLQGWYEPGFDDSTWTSTSLPHDKWIWSTLDSTRVYRKHFTISSKEKIEALQLNYQCDEGCECYVNGELIAPSTSCQTDYPPVLEDFETNEASILDKVVEGDNILACRVVEKKWSQTSFRYFDAGLTLKYDNNGEISLRKMIAAAPNLDRYISVTQSGDWYELSFSPQELSNLPQGGDGNYVIYVETNRSGMPVGSSLSFNIGGSLDSEESYMINIENPNTPNVNYSHLDVKALVTSQTGVRITDHDVDILVEDVETGDLVKECQLNSAGGDDYYYCFVPQTGFEVGKTYSVRVNDKDVKPKGLWKQTTFNIVTPE